MGKIDETINGVTYRTIFEEANLSHPEGSAVGVFTGDGFKDVVWRHVATPSETDEEIRKQAKRKLNEHAHRATKL